MTPGGCTAVCCLTPRAAPCRSFVSAAFAISAACNIGPRAIQHHNWYKDKFKGEYPKERKAFIPFIL